MGGEEERDEEVDSGEVDGGGDSVVAIVYEEMEERSVSVTSWESDAVETLWQNAPRSTELGTAMCSGSKDADKRFGCSSQSTRGEIGWMGIGTK